jgi:hypothetical protein
LKFDVARKHEADPYVGVSSDKRRLALPKDFEHWSLTTLRDKLVKIGAKVVSHGRRRGSIATSVLSSPRAVLFGGL